MIYNENKLSAKDRKELPSSAYGIPETRSYPLNDAEHVRKAIQMFSHCPAEHKKSLARKILRKAKSYNIEIDDNSAIKKALQEDYDFVKLFLNI